MQGEWKKGVETTLVTGATSGIGYELSKLLARSGHSLVLVARDRKRLEEVAGELRKNYPSEVQIIPKDLSAKTAPEEIARELQARSIHIDILVNNAGFNEYGPFSETDLEKELAMIQTHITSLTALTKFLLPGMLERLHGRILNVGSTGSFAPGPLNAVYCATKAYVLSFSEALAEELRGTGVSVTALCPGATRTDFARRAKMEDANIFKAKLMDPGKVAEIGLRALMRGKTTVVAGKVNKITVFSLRFTPRKVVAKIARGIMGKKEGCSC